MQSTTYTEMKKLFGDWTLPLDPILTSKYFEKVMTEVDKYYTKFRYLNSPTKDKVFDAFKKCKYDDLRVVILGTEPYPDCDFATGLCFANPKAEQFLSPALDTIFTSVFPKDGVFDSSLEKWANQGILMLNTALTIEYSSPNSHLSLWKPFIAMVLNHISTQKDYTIFCLWGTTAQSMAKFIDESKHTVLFCEDPAKASDEAREWDCDHFDIINSILNDEIVW